MNTHCVSGRFIRCKCHCEVLYCRWHMKQRHVACLQHLVLVSWLYTKGHRVHKKWNVFGMKIEYSLSSCFHIAPFYHCIRWFYITWRELSFVIGRVTLNDILISCTVNSVITRSWISGEQHPSKILQEIRKCQLFRYKREHNKTLRVWTSYDHTYVFLPKPYVWFVIILSSGVWRHGTKP